MKRHETLHSPVRLNMLIILSFCDLRGTLNGRFVNDYNAESRFLATDFAWLQQKDEDLFGWRKERLVRAFIPEHTKDKQRLWDTTFSELEEETQEAIKRQVGHNIKVFTNLLYLALGLNGEELLKLFALISLIVEMATEGRPTLDFQVDFTTGAERERGKPTPIIDGFKTVLKRVELHDLVLSRVREHFNGQVIYGIPIAPSPEKLIIDSRLGC